MSQSSQRPSGHAPSSHRFGRPNLRIAGLDVNAPVFVISALSIVAFIVGALVFREEATETLLALRVAVTTGFDWLFLSAANALLLFCLLLIVSPLGKVRIGGPGAKPAYSRTTWFAMLFASGMGIGLMFFGVLEPVFFVQNPPLGLDASDPDAARAIGVGSATFHWGLHAWAIYAVVGLGLAFFAFSRGLPLTLRSLFHPLLGDRVWGWSGHLVDIAAVFATLFGLATSLGFGTEQAADGLHYLFGFPASDATRVTLILGVTGIATLSVLTGLDGGIKRLSQTNMALAASLMLFVLAVGPTGGIFESAWRGLGAYLGRIVPLSHWIGREDTAFLHDWTTFYWAWWMSWAPFVGMFIARVSRGRTVREFLVFVLLLPTLFNLLWMSVFGGAALDQFLVDGYTGVTATIAEWRPGLVLFRMLEPLPLAGLASLLSIALVLVFFVTSSDSGSLVIDTITAGGKLDAPVAQRVFWCLAEGLTAIALLLGGGLLALQAASLLMALPLAVLFLVMIGCIWSGLRAEHRRTVRDG